MSSPLPRCQANGETKFWSKLKGGAKGFYKELGGLLPLICSALLRTSCGGHTLKDEVVTTVTLTGKVYRIDEYGKVRCQIADNRPVKTISLRPTAKKKGLLTAASSLREAFLGRESPWKPGSGAIEGEVTTKGGRVQRGLACPYCIRDGRKLEHWGSFSCLLGPKDRKGAHFLFVDAHVGRLLRLESAAVDAAAKREGSGPWGTV